jgi:hypothetical protein
VKWCLSSWRVEALIVALVVAIAIVLVGGATLLISPLLRPVQASLPQLESASH